MELDKIRQLVQETVSKWQQDKASRLAAALSYYTIFSLPPLLLIAVAVAGFFLGRQAVRQQLIDQVSSLMGDAGAQAIGTMLDGAGWDAGASTLATVVGVATLVFGATGAFAQLQEALNTIWHVRLKQDLGLWGTVRSRLLSFSMVLIAALLLLLVLALSTALTAANTYLERLVPGLAMAAPFLDLILSFVVTTLLFAAIYKVLPDVEIAWGDVWIGAAATAFLFTVGKYLLGLYLGRSGASSAYGAAGALILILLWIYYSAHLLFLGAEFTQVYGRRYGSRIVPSDHAVRVTTSEQAKEGISHKEPLRAEVNAHQQPALPSPVASLERPALPPAGGKPVWPRAQPYLVTMLGFAAGWLLGGMYRARSDRSSRQNASSDPQQPG
jgi:membrane protein